MQWCSPIAAQVPRSGLWSNQGQASRQYSVSGQPPGVRPEVKATDARLGVAGRGRFLQRWTRLIRSSLPTRYVYWRTPAVDATMLTDATFPATLAAESRPPASLFVRGPLNLLSSPAVGVCGSRDASHEGLSRANLLS